MKHPPYHLRSNKAVDRLLFAEALHWLGTPKQIAQYTYYGMGGPYMEDFRLLHENFPTMKMVSIEEDPEIVKRQEFHLPCSLIELEHTTLSSFITNYDSNGKSSIFWADNVGLKLSHFDDFKKLLPKVASKSIIKITMQCQSSDYTDLPNKTEKLELFKRKFSEVKPAQFQTIPSDPIEFANLLQEMLQVASLQALPAELGIIFQPISSFYYKDTTGMFTLTGIVCKSDELESIKKKFINWSFANLDWSKPKEIDVPQLSTRERLQFQRHLPHDDETGQQLFEILGYNITSNQESTMAQLRQYANFCRYYPHFIKAIP